MMKEKKSGKWLYIVILHVVFLIVSLGAVASKTAASYPFLSWGFIMYYGLYLLALAVYAVSWVQILKKLPLVVAFSNKAICVVWNIVFGVLIFHEEVKVQHIIAALIVIAGVLLVVTAPEEKEKEAQE